MFYVYVLRSESDSGFYIGFSTNLRQRLKQHTAGKSFATAHRGPWKLIYYEAYLDQEDALGREKYLKSGAGRKFLKAQLLHYLEMNPVRTGPMQLDKPRGRSSVERSKPFTRYTHVLNKPGIGVKSPLD